MMPSILLNQKVNSKNEHLLSKSKPQSLSLQGYILNNFLTRVIIYSMEN